MPDEHFWPPIVVPDPTFTLPEAGYFHGYGPSPAGPLVASFGADPAAPASALLATENPTNVPAASSVTAPRRTMLGRGRPVSTPRDGCPLNNFFMLPPQVG